MTDWNGRQYSRWDAEAARPTTALILPDGCRDLIVKRTLGEKPVVFLSALFDKPEPVLMGAGTTMTGFRLKPGTCVRMSELIDVVTNDPRALADIESILGDYSALSHAAEEALDCLAQEGCTVKQVAGKLGVSTRTLQRLIIKTTDRPASYWLQLGRVRKAARVLSQAACLAETADSYGFSDQSHMTREFNRWFGMTPRKFMAAPHLLAQLQETGYA